MIIVRIIGGLGNQLFQYAMARSISEKLGIEFKLDISGFENYKLHNGYRLNQFNIIENIATNEEIKKFRGYEGIFRRILNKLGLDIKRPESYYQEKFYMRYNEGVFSDNFYFDGYWQNCRYFEDIREILLKELTPKNISNQAKLYLKTIDENSVSIHIRRGDYLKLQNIYNILSVDYYQEAIKILTKTHKNLNFFVFSDDIEWCKNNLNIEATYIEKTTDIDDVFLMSKMGFNIISNSTFSWWGAWLNENNKIVITPKKWFNKKERQNLNINCLNWKKV